MKRPSKEIKRIARYLLNKRYRIPMLIFIIAALVPAIVEIPFSLRIGEDVSTMQLIISLLAEYLILLLSQVLGVGVVYVHLNMTRGWEFKISQIFYPFKNGTDRFLGGSFLLSLLSIGCCMPMIGGAIYFYFADFTLLSIGILIVCCAAAGILAIMYSLNYNFVLYFLLDYPQMKVIDAFKESRRLMKGNKGRLFYIQCSYIGWYLLRLCSLGIASLWVGPYLNQIMVTFYLDCTGELNQIPVRQYDTLNTGYSNPIY